MTTIKLRHWLVETRSRAVNQYRMIYESQAVKGHGEVTEVTEILNVGHIRDLP